MKVLPNIYSPVNLGLHNLKNRFVMAPMTRCRSAQPGDVPNQMMAEYYAQRSFHTGLIISEGSQISPQGKGYSLTPGIYSQEQISGWRQVTEAVHNNDGKIYLQLWHVGSISRGSLHKNGVTVGPSSICPQSQVWILEENGTGKRVDCPMPQALTEIEIQNVINDFRTGARNAIDAGFDGVEIHGAHGYLIDQFLRTSTNIRTDQYGGSVENRIRLAIEIAKAVSDEIGTDRTGIRLSPYIKQQGFDPIDSIVTFLKL